MKYKTKILKRIQWNQPNQTERTNERQKARRNEPTNELRKYGKIQIKLLRNAGYAGFVCFLSLDGKRKNLFATLIRCEVPL